MDPVELTDEQQRTLTAISAVEAERGAPPTLSQLAAHLDVSLSEARERVAGLLGGDADLVRELAGPEPDGARYTVKSEPHPEGRG